jgi:hypothetical protein
VTSQVPTGLTADAVGVGLAAGAAGVRLAAATVGLAARLCATEGAEAAPPQAETVSARAAIATIFFTLLLIAIFCFFLSNTGKLQDWDISTKLP